MPTTEWMTKYKALKDKLNCKIDLESYFTEKVIGKMAVDVLWTSALSTFPPERSLPVTLWSSWRMPDRLFRPSLPEVTR